MANGELLFSVGGSMMYGIFALICVAAVCGVVALYYRKKKKHKAEENDKHMAEENDKYLAEEKIECEVREKERQAAEANARRKAEELVVPALRSQDAVLFKIVSFNFNRDAHPFFRLACLVAEKAHAEVSVMLLEGQPVTIMSGNTPEPRGWRVKWVGVFGDVKTFWSQYNSAWEETYKAIGLDSGDATPSATYSNIALGRRSVVDFDSLLEDAAKGDLLLYDHFVSGSGQGPNMKEGKTKLDETNCLASVSQTANDGLDSCSDSPLPKEDDGRLGWTSRLVIHPETSNLSLSPEIAKALQEASRHRIYQECSCLVVEASGSGKSPAVWSAISADLELSCPVCRSIVLCTIEHDNTYINNSRPKCQSCNNAIEVNTLFLSDSGKICIIVNTGTYPEEWAGPNQITIIVQRLKVK